MKTLAFLSAIGLLTCCGVSFWLGWLARGKHKAIAAAGQQP